MYLTFNAHGTGSTNDQDFKLDLAGIMDNDDVVVDVNTLYTSLVMRLAKWAHEKAVDFDDIFPLYIHDGEYWDNDCEKLDAGPDDWGWIKEVAQFAWAEHLNLYVDSDQLFAVVNNVGWKYFDFDNIEDALSEDYHGEFDGDHSDFAREWDSNFDFEPLPERFHHHIDWDSYGESLVNDFNRIEWNDRTFLYNQ